MFYCKGTPPALHRHKDDDISNSLTFFAKPTRRPSSLPLKNKEKPHYCSTDDVTRVNGVKIKKERPDSDEECPSTSNGVTDQARRLSLEETVNMLRQSYHKARDQNYSKHSLSPSQSESRSSRRSSRSTTPNVTPVKTDILTPCSTPSSSPDKTPCPSPTTEGVSRMRKKKNQRGAKSYLFAKNDEVLARWHDGRFYLGKILKVI